MKRNLPKLILALLVAAACLPHPPPALAQIMTSTNYRIPFDAFGGGGLRSTSASYGLEDTLSEFASPTGENLASASYRACVGYQCLSEAPFLTVDYAVQSSPCSDTSVSSPPFVVALGTLSTAAVSTASNRICVRVSTNTDGGVVVQGYSANAALASVSVPGDTIPSVTATLVPAVSGYGFCSSNAQNGFTAQSPFNGSCDTGSNHAVGAITTSDQTIWSAPGPVSNAYGELLTKASISSVVPAHNDYQDTLTITVTGTY